MTEHTIEIKIKNSDCFLPKGKRSLLSYPDPGLIPCQIEEDEDEFTMIFLTDELHPFEDIKTNILQEKYRLLCNCGELSRLCSRYQFRLSPDNLWFDWNLCPKIMVRDLHDGAEEEEETFLKQYQALAASVLYNRYQFEDYYEGGGDLYRKRSVLKAIAGTGTPKELQDYLKEQYEKELEHTRKDKTLVNRSVVKTMRISVPVMAILTILAVGWGGYLGIREVPLKNRLLAGQASYLREDFVGVQSRLAEVEQERLPYESKYTLARSTVRTESLTPEQKETVLEGLTLKTDQAVFDYWISIGRSDFPGAIDTAQRLGNDELLLFAYIKYNTAVKSDTEMDGEKKASLTSELNQKIQTLTEEIEEKKGEADESDPVQ